MAYVKVVALIDHEYAQVKRKKGEAYEADEKFLKTLQVRGRVKLHREDMEPKKPAQYKRRDMRAED